MPKPFVTDVVPPPLARSSTVVGPEQRPGLNASPAHAGGVPEATSADASRPATRVAAQPSTTAIATGIATGSAANSAPASTLGILPPIAPVILDTRRGGASRFALAEEAAAEYCVRDLERIQQAGPHGLGRALAPAGPPLRAWLAVVVVLVAICLNTWGAVVRASRRAEPAIIVGGRAPDSPAPRPAPSSVPASRPATDPGIAIVRTAPPPPRGAVGDPAIGAAPLAGAEAVRAEDTVGGIAFNLGDRPMHHRGLSLAAGDAAVFVDGPFASASLHTVRYFAGWGGAPVVPGPGMSPAAVASRMPTRSVLIAQADFIVRGSPPAEVRLYLGGTPSAGSHPVRSLADLTALVEARGLPARPTPIAPQDPVGAAVFTTTPDRRLEAWEVIDGVVTIQQVEPLRGRATLTIRRRGVARRGEAQPAVARVRINFALR